MADTQRTVASILALLADNTTGDVSQQDLRDSFVSWRNGWGLLSVPAASAAAITISDTSSYFEATAPAYSLASGAQWFDESGGNGRLTYTGTPDVTAVVIAVISQTSASSNQVFHWRIGKNATSDATTEIQRKQGTGSDVGALGLVGIFTLSTNDYVSLMVKNATTASNVTIEVCTLAAITLPA